MNTVPHPRIRIRRPADPQPLTEADKDALAAILARIVTQMLAGSNETFVP